MAARSQALWKEFSKGKTRITGTAARPSVRVQRGYAGLEDMG